MLWGQLRGKVVVRGKPGFSCCAPLQPTEVFHAGRPGRPDSNPPPSSSSCGALGIHRASLKLSFLICYIMPVSQIRKLSPGLSNLLKKKKKALIIQSCPTLCNSMDCSPPGSSVHGDLLGKNTGVSSHSLLQGIFPTQGSNPGLLNCRQILYCLSHQGSPRSAEGHS